MLIGKYKILYLFVIFFLQLSNIAISNDIEHYTDIDDKIIQQFIDDKIIDRQLNEDERRKVFKKIKEKYPEMIQQKKEEVVEKEIDEDEKWVFSDRNKTNGLAFTISPIAYWNTHRNGFDLGLNFYMYYKFRLSIYALHEGLDFFMSMYTLYGAGNAKGESKSKVFGESLKYKIHYAITLDFGLRIRFNNKMSFSMILLGLGYAWYKINITNIIDGGGFVGGSHSLIFHWGFEFRYDRFFTRLELLLSHVGGEYIDGNGRKRTYSGSPCNADGSGGVCGGSSSLDVLLGVGVYLF